MSEDNIAVKSFILAAYIPVQPGSTQVSINYFKWDGQGNLAYAPGQKGAALFKPHELERTVKLLQANNFPYKLQPQPVR